MKLGLALPHYDFSHPTDHAASLESVVGYARHAEAAGYESVWVSDHLFFDLEKYGGPARRYGTPEALAMMGAVVAATERVRVGSLVLCAPFRTPAVLGLQAASLNEYARGRLELGLGAGWYEPEFAEAGIAFGTAGSRIRRLAEVAASLRAMRGVPPVTVGGKGGPKLMNVVARHADGWNISWRVTPEAYRGLLDVLARACESAGRDPAEIELSIGLLCLLGEGERDLRRRYEALRAWTPGRALDAVPLESFAAGALVGTPDEAAARVKEFEALGVSRIIVSFAGLPFSVFDDEQIDIAASELIPRVR